MLARTLVVLLVAGLLVPLSSAPGDAEGGLVTSVTAVDTEGDSAGFGGGATWYGTSQVSVSGDVRSGITVTTTQSRPRGSSATFRFVPPRGQSLTAGTYDSAVGVDAAAGDHPQMLASGDVAYPHPYFDDCRDLAGSFSIADISPDLSRLTIRYTQHCGGKDNNVFGEIRYQEPGGDGELTVAPGRLDWPASYRNATHTAPVTLVNTGAVPVRVYSATISSGQSQFAVLENRCGTLAPGEECQLFVGFTPRFGQWHRGRLTVRDSTTAGTHVVPLSGQEYAGFTSWRLHSQYGDFIGDGVDDVDLEPRNVDFDTDAAGSTRIRVANPDQEILWDATFHRLPDGPGTYSYGGRDHYGESGIHPYLLVDANGHSCGNEEHDVTGSMTVRELTRDDRGYLKSFSATFSQSCVYDDGRGSPELLGSIAYHATQLPAPVPAGDRRPTEFQHHAVDRTTVTDGDVVRLSGKLAEPYFWLPGRSVGLYRRTHPAGAWTLVGSDATDDEHDIGTYALTTRVAETTDYQVRFAGDRDFLPSVSPVVAVSARWAPTLAGPFAAGSGRRRLSASLPHGRAGQHVALERLVGGTWVGAGQLTLSSTGAATTYVRRPSGRTAYRLSVPTCLAHVGATSNEVVVQ